ncbi:MAG: helix-turn-helix domain-containing protein [Pirellulaceae bacterium]
MATVDYTAMPTDVINTSPIGRHTPPEHGPRMHRIRTVRLQQGASLRSVARNSGADVRQLRLQEQESTDVRLSDLHRWQKALDVPLAELLVEPEGALSQPVMERARMVRLMKTAVAIRERSESVGIRRMAQMMCEQLAEIMPELTDVSPWHDYGQRRSMDELGRIVDRTISDDLFHQSSFD